MPKVKALANLLVDRSCIARLIDGSLIQRAVDWANDDDSVMADEMLNPMRIYLNTYRYNLMYFEVTELTKSAVYGVHLSSKLRLRLDKRYLTVDIAREADRVQKEGYKGFYACVSTYAYEGQTKEIIVRGLWVSREELVEYFQMTNGNFPNLHYLLRLNANPYSTYKCPDRICSIIELRVDEEKPERRGFGLVGNLMWVIASYSKIVDEE
ncbi:hypothetical protein M434DRAFT_33281 [Hypoxylon sp. CO27-5]|nr:hypothetical protein M434DRAFT_33281 [Hypoxylon sp. CO27-5]